MRSIHQLWPSGRVLESSSGGGWFESCRVLGFFLLLLSFPTFLHKWNVLNQVPQGGASLTVCCENKKNGCQGVLPVAKQVQILILGKQNPMEGICSERSKTARHTSVGLFILGLVYVGQGESVFGVPEDRNVEFFGSEDATTCHVLILRSFFTHTVLFKISFKGGIAQR